MLFNSIEFLIFLPIVFLIYWYLLQKSLKLQNIFILLSSYLFYGWWDWRFLFLIAFSTIVDYLIGKKISISTNNRKRRLLLILSLTINLGLLGYFKYCNFFLDSFVDAFTFFGSHIEVSSIDIILPVGISFYTFQTLSYTIDVYKRKITACNDPIVFAAFVSFFPQLVAGPIERASHLLPQFFKPKKFDSDLAIGAIKLIIWGMFKKVVISDSLSPIVDDIFTNYHELSGSALISGSVFFAIQIYCDFSGYSDIAIGTARLFGFDLMTNFNFPYFSKSIGEFWRRWHISLSTWFRDYIYIPLGGSKNGTWNGIRNIAITFIISGFWHGANWTFIFWGGIHALLYLPSFFLKKKELVPSRFWIISKAGSALKIGITFSIVTFTWIYFRSESLHDANAYILRIFTHFRFTVEYKFQILLCLLFLCLDFIKMKKVINNEYVLGGIYFLLFIITYYNFGQKSSFIYFQF